jgi:catechol 2,3-dioxygenase-like lactoylglutathione lyase family enzyme
MTRTPPLCQVALSVLDLERTLDWYRRGFGFLPAGGRRGGGPVVASLQGLESSAFEVAWLVDRQECFQLEIFRFDDPAPRVRERAPEDIGYGMLGIHVDDFDRALQRLSSLGSEPLAAPHGQPGRRRACVRDPDGVHIELLEDDAREPGADRRTRPHVPSVVRSVTASVPDLGRARRFWCDTVGLREVLGVELHERQAGRERALLWGRDIALELVEHTDPRGRSWPPGYRISDQGIVNVAIGGPDLATYEAVLERTRRGGYRHHPEADLPGARAVYLDDDQGFSLELLYRSAETAATAGFVPLGD